MRTQWLEGLSETSCGRFGGYREFVFEEAPFLCWNADQAQLRLNTTNAGDGATIFRFLPRWPYRLEKSESWVGRTYRYLRPEGRQHAAVYQSLLSPGLVIESQENQLLWESTEMFSMSMAFVGLDDEVRIVNAAECDPARVVFQGDMTMARPWLLQWPVSGPSIPLLFVFERRPESLYNITRGQRIRFPGPAGKVGIFPIFGIVGVDSILRKQMRSQLSPELVQTCEQWARLMMAFPIDCDEHFQIDDEAGEIAIRNRYQFLEFDSDWKTPPLKAAPIPPIVTMARQSGYPIKLSGRAMQLRFPVRGGWFDAIEGDELTYVVPACRLCHEIIAPLRVENDPVCDQLTERLRQQIAQPVYTFGGDNTYDPDNIQDILHNLRVLGWACMSLRPEERQSRFENLARELKGFAIENYEIEIEPTTGRQYVWEKHIWRGDNTTVDIEWYNGMQLAGLWAAAYYSDDSKYFNLIAERWDLVQRLFNYYEIWNDWATLSTWTSLTKLFLWTDGLHFAWQGFLGLARLARMQGDESLRRKAEYHAAKTAITRYACLMSAGYAEQVRALGERREPAKAHFFRMCGGYESRVGFGATSVELKGMGSFSPATIVSHNVPELLLFYWSLPLAREYVRTYEYEAFPQAVPNWRSYYTRSGSGEGPDHPHPLYPSHTHFYYVDMHLMTRALMFREELPTLLDHVADLTGPVIEHYLVGSHPVAIVPTYMLMKDNVWDEATQTLTTTLVRDEKVSDIPAEGTMRLWTRRPPQSVEQAAAFTFDPTEEMCTIRFRPTDRVVIRAKF